MRASRVAVALLLVTLAGVAMRLLPLLPFAVWGSDVGEYHRIAQGLLDSGALSTDYDGWGVAYPWFPGMFAVAGAVSATTGLDLRWSLEILIPALAGLSALAGALLAYQLRRDARAALLAGLALAVAMPNAFATSHAMPGAVGHLFLLAALLLFWERGRSAWLAGAVCALALVPTHHLSTYMLLVALGGMVAARALLVTTPGRWEHRRLLGALVLTLVAALTWWTWARPIREQIVPTFSSFGLAGLGLAAALGVLLLALLPHLRGRWAWRFRPRYPSAAQGLRVVAVMCGVVLAGSAAIGFTRVPGTSVQVTPAGVLWFMPLALLLSFGFLGSGLAKFRPRGVLTYGWALGLLLSFFLAMLARSVVLIPYRHAEYIVEVAAVLAGLGLAAGLAHAGRAGRGRIAFAGVAALLLLNGALAYPPPDVLAGFQEGTTAGEMAAVRWARAHVHLQPDAVIAADHRMSSMLFGYAGLNATWEYAPLTFRAATFEEARPEMERVPAPSGAKRVDYVFLSRAMREHLALLQWDAAEPLSPAAQAKFTHDAHYVPMCHSAEVDIYGVQWVVDPLLDPRVLPCEG